MMTKHKIFLCIITLLLIIGLGWFLLYQAGSLDELPVSVIIASGDHSEEIFCWQKNEHDYYVFIPSYADLSQVWLCVRTENEVRMDGKVLSYTMNCHGIELDTPHEMTYTAWGSLNRDTITFIRSGNVATMYIDTQSGSMEYIHEKKGNEETGQITLYTAEGEKAYEGNLDFIKGRGNSTWDYFDKKQYSIQLSAEASLLGLGQAQKWVLMANADDPSNIRNRLVYDFAEKAGVAYSPDTQWIDLYLNGQYAGLYLLSERNEVHPERVNISSDGILVSMEVGSRLILQNYPYVMTKEKQALRIHYPENISDRQQKEIEKMMQSVENAVLAEDGVDPVTGKPWDEIIDLDSWARKYLIEEIFANVDACTTSQYYYSDGELIYAGPVWDYDHAMGAHGEWSLANPHSFCAYRLHVKPGYDAPWFYALYQNKEFFNRVVELYETEYLPLLEDFLNERLNGYVDQISIAAKMNAIRWEQETNGLLSETEYVRGFLEKRTAFLSKVWLGKAKYHIVQADKGHNGFYAYYVVFEGESLPELPVFEGTDAQIFQGWYYKDTNTPVDPARPVTEDMEIYAAWQDSPSKRLDQIGKLLPLGVIAVMGVIILLVEIRRMRKSR